MDPTGTRKVALEEEMVIRVMTEKDGFLSSLELSKPRAVVRARIGQKRPETASQGKIYSESALAY